MVLLVVTGGNNKAIIGKSLSLICIYISYIHEVAGFAWCDFHIFPHRSTFIHFPKLLLPQIWNTKVSHSSSQRKNINDKHFYSKPNLNIRLNHGIICNLSRGKKWLYLFKLPRAHGWTMEIEALEIETTPLSPRNINNQWISLIYVSSLINRFLVLLCLFQYWDLNDCFSSPLTCSNNHVSSVSVPRLVLNGLRVIDLFCEVPGKHQAVLPHGRGKAPLWRLEISHEMTIFPLTPPMVGIRYHTMKNPPRIAHKERWATNTLPNMSKLSLSYHQLRLSVISLQCA